MSQYKLVPVEPTPEMLEAYCGAQPSNIAVYLSDGVEPYKAMLAAAPAVQEERQEAVEVVVPAKLTGATGFAKGIEDGWNAAIDAVLRLNATPQPSLDVRTLVEALEWYAEKVKECRKIRAEGDNARQALDLDGGFRALDALAAQQSATAGEREVVYMMRRTDEIAWYVTTFQTFEHIASGKSPQHEAVKLYSTSPVQPAAPELVSVPRDLLADLISSDHDTKIQAERALYALLASHAEGEA